MKMNSFDNEDLLTIVCPACKETSEVVRVGSPLQPGFSIDATSITLHSDVGNIYVCMNPKCGAYLEKTDGEFVPIAKQDIIRRQKEITDLISAESELAIGRQFPKITEVRAKAEAAGTLSSVLYNLMFKSDFRRAYSFNEIIEACEALRLHPSKVTNEDVRYVVTWLEENKGK